MKGKNLPIPNLKTIREENGYTQTAFAALLGCDVKTYRKYEKGAEYPKLECLIDLSDRYHVSIDFLLGRSCCRSVDNEYIHNVLGLSDKAISNLKAYKAHDEMFNFTNSLKSTAWNFLEMDLRLPFINFLLTSSKLSKLINTFFVYSCPEKFSKLAVKFNDLQIAEIPQNSLVLSANNDLTDNIPINHDSELNKAIFKTKMDIIINELSEDYKKTLPRN